MSETMNIYANEGDKVKFSYPENGYDYDIEKGKKYLEVGKVYTVDYTDVHSYTTDVYIKEVPNISFNSVLFSDTDDKKEMMNNLNTLLEDLTSAYKLDNNVAILQEDIIALEWAIKELEKKNRESGIDGWN